MKQTILFLVSFFLINNAFAQVVYPGDEVKPGINLLGDQVIKGDLAFVIYTNIKGEEEGVRQLCVPGRNCDSGIQFYLKTVQKLQCGYEGEAYSCFLSNIHGGEPVIIKSSKVNRRLYETLISTPLPTGYSVNTPSVPEGYTKTVVGISCTRSLDNEFECSIRYRQ